MLVVGCFFADRDVFDEWWKRPVITLADDQDPRQNHRAWLVSVYS